MKAVVILSSVLLLLNSVAAWQVDPRCPDPVNRRLEEGGEDELEDLDDFASNKEYPTSDAGSSFANAVVTPALRGQSRKLAAAPDTFLLKMYWERGFCWQEEWDVHRKWCWECKGSCKENQELWWQKCNGSNKNQQFSYIASNTDEQGQFRWAHGNLCLQRVSSKNFKLKACSNHPNQVIVDFRADGKPFELQPKGDSNKCINQHHHPKAGEIVENTRCKTARIWKTNLMEIYKIDDHNADFNIDDPDSARLRNPQCSSNKPCDRCEGDCDKDNHCKGNLVCFQRKGSDGTKYSPVPGCNGDPRPGT
jgi:hypothetical protein